jgi:hypothetical protein
MVEYGSKSWDDEEADMCIAEWSWASKYKPFVCSNLKPTSRSRKDEIRYTFNVAKCDRIFDYLLQEKQIKLPSNHVIPLSEQLEKHVYYKWYNSYSHATNDCNIFYRQVQSGINEGQLKFTESPQMKLDKDPFSANMNTVKLDGKKVLVQPSQAESTNGKKVVIGEERQPRMIKPKIQKLADGRRMREASHDLVQKPHSTSSWLNTDMARPASGVIKTEPSGFPVSGQYFYDRKIVQQPIQDTTTTEFRRSGSSSTRASSDA